MVKVRFFEDLCLAYHVESSELHILSQAAGVLLELQGQGLKRKELKTSFMADSRISGEKNEEVYDQLMQSLEDRRLVV